MPLGIVGGCHRRVIVSVVVAVTVGLRGGEEAAKEVDNNVTW